MQEEKSQHLPNKLNRTFARRRGKGLSDKKKLILEKILPRYLFTDEKIDTLQTDNKLIMEVGFGMGDHLVQQMKVNPNATFLGAEVYVNGVAQFLELGIDSGIICAAENKNNNLFLWPDDVDLLFDMIPQNSLDIIYILFPDPWPKKKHNKKRLVNNQRLNTIKDKLKSKGQIIFATDIDDYFDSVYELIDQDNDLEFLDEDFTTPHAGYILTKYNKKAIREGRVARFMRISYKKCHKI